MFQGSGSVVRALAQRSTQLLPNLTSISSSLVTCPGAVGADFMVSQRSRHPAVVIESTLARLGLTLDFSQESDFHIILPCLVTPVLYLGPLYACYLAEALPFQRRWSFSRDFLSTFASWIGVRNYIVVRRNHYLSNPNASDADPPVREQGPITEEVVFRACVLAVYHMAGASRKKMIFLSPLVFGVGQSSILPPEAP